MPLIIRTILKSTAGLNLVRTNSRFKLTKICFTHSGSRSNKHDDMPSLWDGIQYQQETYRSNNASEQQSYGKQAS